MDAGPKCQPKSLTGTRTASQPTIDGKLDEPSWLKTATSGPFIDSQQPAETVPHTEARVLWDAQGLYVALYAADEDIRTNDFVGLVVRPPGSSLTFSLELPPSGQFRCRLSNGEDCSKIPGLRATVDSDGSLDDDGDDDEEWTAEIVMPWSTLGLNGAPKELAVNFTRRDRPKHAKEHRLLWSPDCGNAALGILHLEPQAR